MMMLVVKVKKSNWILISPPNEGQSTHFHRLYSDESNDDMLKHGEKKNGKERKQR